jgi:cytidylate kinase
LLDTGALYRTVAVAARRASLAFEDAASVGSLARNLATEGAITVAHDGATGMRVFLRGEDVSGEIRTPDMAMGASTVSAHPAVREALLALQRQAGTEGGVVLEGRDIGTVVFPDAEVKFFLTAQPEVRARRRFDELTAKGQNVTFEDTLEDVLRRDAQDTQRAVAPLRQADDAILVDSSALDIDGVVERMVRQVHARQRP